jgi:hypothetical protein
MFKMFKENLLSYFSMIESFLRKYFSQILCYVVLLIAIITTFSLQNRIVGWEQGYDDLQPKHHGWVSAHTMAIISKAIPENNFVGYALAYKDDQNNIQYEYFDRYPIFFSALFNKVISLRSKLSDQIYIAKQVMNLIFLCTIIIAFLLIDKLIGNKPLALTIVLLAFSNPFLLFYKDMIHFDQPALFGLLLLIYAIALYKIDGLKIPLYIATFVATSLGRGYASYAVFIVWLCIEAFMILKSKGLGFIEKIKNILKHPSFFLFIIGIVWGASLLSYNLFIEARKRNVPIWETSILVSAEDRLSLNEEFNQENMGIINWREFTAEQINRIVKWSFPVRDVNFKIQGTGLILAIMCIVMGIFIRRQPVEKRIIYLILVLFGFVWLFPLRNLAAFHDYTTMYYIGIPLVFFVSVFAMLNPSKETAHYLVIMGLIIYVFAIYQVKDLHEKRAGDASVYTYDFMRIRQKIDGTGKNVYIAVNIPYGPYPAGYYLNDQYISPHDLADYIITPNRDYSPDNLTPDNDILFLFKKVK